MCNVSSNFLPAYDSDLELHSDSSDFEGTQSPVVTDKKGKHKFYMKKLYPNHKENFHLQTCKSHDYTVTEDTSKEMWETQTAINQHGETISEIKVQKSYKNRKYKTLDSGDQIQTIKSKRSLIRHKVIPCLSTMFGRTNNNVKQMSIIKENQAENVNIDNGCQASVNSEHKIRKLNRRQQCYAVQPVYAVEGNIHSKPTPFQHTKIVREPLSPRKTVEKENSNMTFSLTSSSEGNGTRRMIKRKKSKRKKSNQGAKPYISKDNSPYYGGSDLKCNIEQQCPSKLSPKSPYHVYTSPCQYQRTSAGCSPLPSDCVSGNELPATCSGFWEYLFNKINTKYHYQCQGIANSFRSCKCNNNACSSQCCGPTCEKNSNPKYMNPQQAFYNQNNPMKQESCSCSNTLPQPSPLNTNDNIQPRPSPAVPPFKIKAPEKVQCKCYSKIIGAQSPQAPGVPKSTSPVPLDTPRPCQLPHDEITGTLIQKYNGEILCIHNPPCVLINGCLNLPPPKEEMTMDMYPVATNVNSNKSGFQHVHTKVPKKQKSAQYCLPPVDKQQGLIMDESCQYFPPTRENLSENDKLNESCQYQIPEKLKKQMMVTDDSCQYQLEHSVRHQNIANESCQYRVSPFEIPKQQVTTNESCQYRVSPFDMPKQQTNESCQYRISPFDLPKQQTNESCQYRASPHELPKQLATANESCQYRVSPFEIPKRQITTNESYQYKVSPYEVPKQVVTANESCQYWISHTETQKPHMAANESCQYRVSPMEIPKQHIVSSNNYRSEKSEPIIELKPVKAKKEKIVQSICNHNPPCEVVRTCCKTKFDPKLQNSCVHVPMCEKVPLCLMELKVQNQEMTSCQHKPKCAEVPICTRNYIILTAKEEAATQVRPKTKMVCRHEPPCIMIPKCLARVCDSCIPYDAIPDCVHQPMCEMIPACCRKSAKEMVSVRSQYPNQCSIA